MLCPRPHHQKAHSEGKQPPSGHDPGCGMEARDDALARGGGDSQCQPGGAAAARSLASFSQAEASWLG